MSPMEFVVYIYASKSPVTDLRHFRCPNCGRVVFKHNGSRLTLTNAYGASYQQLAKGSHFTEHKCHSCKALYQIMYQ